MQATASLEVLQVASMGQEIAEVATTCFIITLVVRVQCSTFAQRLVADRVLHCRALQSASCCCAWRLSSRVTPSSLPLAMSPVNRRRHQLFEGCLPGRSPASAGF